MYQVTVRRHQADEARSPNDFVINDEDAKGVEAHLREVLRAAQAERGSGVWSDADPKVWMGAALVGRLERGGDVSRLARKAMDGLNPAGYPR
jgi:hypothetical protein